MTTTSCMSWRLILPPNSAGSIDTVPTSAPVRFTTGTVIALVSSVKRATGAEAPFAGVRTVLLFAMVQATPDQSACAGLPGGTAVLSGLSSRRKEPLGGEAGSRLSHEAARGVLVARSGRGRELIFVALLPVVTTAFSR
jgi:hypothetical protein